MAEWAGIVNTTTKQFLKGAEDQTLRNRIFLKMMGSKGRISYNNGGTSFQWQVEALQPAVTPIGDGQGVNYARVDKYRTLELDYGMMFSGDAVTIKERALNKGTPALINRFKEIVPGLKKSMDNKAGQEFYVDGGASNNENRWDGLESIFAAGTTVAADICAQPGETSYAGRSLVPGVLSTDWTTDLSTKPNANLATDWPDGTGDSGYDYISPRMANWSSTNWNTGVQTWEDNCQRVIRKLYMWCLTGGGKEGVPDCILLNPILYSQYCDKQDAKQRVTITPSATMKEFGYAGVNQEGMDITHEYGVPANSGYALNFDEMELKVCEEQLFVPDGPTYDPRTLSWLFGIYCIANLKINPKGQGKLKNFAS